MMVRCAASKRSWKPSAWTKRCARQACRKAIRLPSVSLNWSGKNRLKRKKFIYIVGIFIFLCCSAVYWPFLPFFPIQEIKVLPKKDLLIFSSYLFSNREFLNDGPSLLVVDPETGLIYNWHRLLHVRGDHYWTGIQDKVLISTGGTYAGEPINSSLLTTDGDIEHVNLYGELSPDGNKIAYTEKFSLFIYDLLTQRSIKITPPNIWVDDFSWSPDSKYISFISPNQVNEVFEGAYKPSDSFKIMRVRVTDGSVFPVTKSLRDEYAWDLQWSGDGAMLSLYYDSNI